MLTDQLVSCVPSTVRVEQMEMIRNLIEVKIPDEQLNSANFRDGLKIEVRCEKPFTVSAFWIVKILELHPNIEKNWETMRDELWEGKFLADESKCLFRSRPIIHQESNANVQCEIKPPEPIDTSDMKTTPRDFYPLVIIVTCHEEGPSPIASAAAANIHIVHIQDSIVPIKSHVIKQYIKQNDGRILDVSRLYAEESAACFICFEEADLDERLQLFCLLPCRHAPICSNCITRVRECPKCRCPIASVFDINAPTPNSIAAATARGTIDPSLRHLYDDADEGNNNGQGGPRRQSGFIASIKSMFGF